MKNRIFAWLNLAFRFALHILWRTPGRWLRGRPDYQRFRTTVEQEGYAPLPAQARARFPEFMSCIHCGLCSLACPELRAAPSSAWSEAWTFVAGPARSLERAPLVVAGISACAECEACAAVCPTGVPIPYMAAVIKQLGPARNRSVDHGEPIP
jgi:succinate dehydrogenase/fumarate reductase-like Fe-S protein